jgi:hypothetical protein
MTSAQGSGRGAPTHALRRLHDACGRAAHPIHCAEAARHWCASAALPSVGTPSPDARPAPLAAAERDSACLPLGVVVQPFAQLSAAAPATQQLLGADSLPRCGDCAAYICGFCQLEREGWVCALCGASKRTTTAGVRVAFSPLTKTSPAVPAGRFTKFDKAVRDRYRRSTRRVDVPELAAPVYECLVASQVVPWQTAPLSTRCVRAGWLAGLVCNAERSDTVCVLQARLRGSGGHLHRHCPPGRHPHRAAHRPPGGGPPRLVRPGHGVGTCDAVGCEGLAAGGMPRGCGAQQPARRRRLSLSRACVRPFYRRHAARGAWDGRMPAKEEHNGLKPCCGALLSSGLPGGRGHMQRRHRVRVRHAETRHAGGAGCRGARPPWCLPW